jgi:hypothetical protein
MLLHQRYFPWVFESYFAATKILDILLGDVVRRLVEANPGAHHFAVAFVRNTDNLKTFAYWVP